MKVKVNGKNQEYDNDQIGLVELLKKNNVYRPELVSIQINGSFLKRDLYNETMIKENDELDFLFFMGGGSPSAKTR